MKISGHKIDISSREKIFFPEAGLTKGDLIDYYHQVAEVMVPHMRNYGVSMQRFPDGITDSGFYNKDAPDYFPDWIKTVNFPKREGGSFNAPIVDSTAVLVYLADQAVVTHHLYLSPAEDLEHPDKIVYDLDPPEDSEDFSPVREAALDLQSVMHELNLAAFVQTTGSKGFHIIVPIQRQYPFDDVRQFAEGIARLLMRRAPGKYTLEQRKNKRKGKIFLDVLRNAYGATSVAPYSVRARKNATVATPVDWSEIESGASPRDWTLKSIPSRLAQKEDPWKGILRHARSIEPRRETLEKLLQKEEPIEEELD